ncbi:hypothetical protein CASFOL_028939 [Castilleja foliolosa]|uniref:Uncharacterized protein n=1 Tax=Castilleja foliolosa TaxID=1961234 RepID=A0ABD3CCM6_9LAMI
MELQHHWQSAATFPDRVVPSLKPMVSRNKYSLSPMNVTEHLGEADLDGEGGLLGGLGDCAVAVDGDVWNEIEVDLLWIVRE